MLVGFDANHNKKGRLTLFQLACESGHAHIVRYLVSEAGANTAATGEGDCNCGEHCKCASTTGALVMFLL